MKPLKPLASLLLLSLCAISLADTTPVQLVYNTGITGKAAVVRVVVTDSTGAVVVASTNAPGGVAFAESTVIPGEYYAAPTLTYTPANLPLRAEFTTSDGSIGAAPVTMLSDRAANAAAGYTAALPGTITSKTNLIATNAGDSPNAITAQTTTASNGTAITGINTKLGTPAGASVSADLAANPALSATAVWGTTTKTITGGTVTTVTNPVVASSVTGAVGSVTGNVGGSVASVTAPVTLPSTILQTADVTAITNAIMTYALHTGVSFQKAVSQVYLATAGTVAPSKIGTVSTNAFKWPDGVTGQTSTLDSSTNARTETPGTLPN